MKNYAKIIGFALALTIIMASGAFALSKRQIRYPFGFKHGMSAETAMIVLKSLEARIIKMDERSIHAHYNKKYYGVIIEDIDLRFFDGRLKSVTLRTNGEPSDRGHEKRLKEFANLIKANYEVDERSNGSSIDSTTDIKTRFVSRYQDGSYELLIYSYYQDDKYYLTLNFEKFF
jgi:hypothetical protein